MDVFYKNTPDNCEPLQDKHKVHICAKEAMLSEDNKTWQSRS